MTNFIFENTWEENQEALKTKKLAIIPVGSSEQHGPALPVGTDWMIAQYLAQKSRRKDRQRSRRSRRSIWSRIIPRRFSGNHGCFSDYPFHIRQRSL